MANMGDRTVYDRTLSDPDAAALDAVLRDALAIANEGNDSKSKHLKWPPADLPPFLRHLDATPEGLHGWHGGKKAKYYAGKSQVTVAWWTNMLGEKHVRVLGGHGLTTGARLRIGETGQFHGGTRLSCAELLYPERTARVSRAGGTKSLVGVCDCGAVGSFAALGWTGPCCGPCRDHRMDGNAALPIPWHVGGVKYGPHGIRRVTALAFDPAGGSLLFSHDGLWRWTLATGAVEPLQHPSDVVNCWNIKFLPDDKRAVLFCFRQNDARTIAVWEPGAATGSEWHLPPEHRIALCLAPDGETIAISHSERTKTKPKLRVRSVHDGAIVRELGTPAVDNMQFSPDGRLLLITAQVEGPTLLDVRTGKRVHEFPSVQQRNHVFHSNGRDLYAISDAVADGGVTYEGAGMRLHVVRSPVDTPLYYATHFLTVAPDGGALVAGVFNSLHFWELTDGRVGAECEFVPSGEALERFAWSPDGRHLATADRGGTVRLWPWPAVYEAARAAGT